MNRFRNIFLKLFTGMSILSIAVIIGILFGVRMPASAAGGISVLEVNYDTSLVSLQLTGEDTRVYISDAKMKKWEYVPTAKASDGTISFDISWISATRDYTLSIKGDVSTEPVQVVIPKQTNKFKVTYDVASGLVKFINDEGRAVQWKKKNGYRWNNAGTPEELKAIFNGMIANGAVLSFRLAPRNGSGTDGGLRPSKEVSLTIPKKTAAPKITVNDTLMAIPVVKGLEYRYTDENGMPLESAVWTLIEEAGNKPLSEIAPKAIYKEGAGNEENGENSTATQDQYIQFRTQASGSKQMSNNTTIKIPAQEPLSKDETDSFEITYKSSASFAIKVGKASSTNIYEYCIINSTDIEAGIDLNKPEELTWKEISSPDPVNISKTKNSCDDGSKIYIRRKAVKSLGDDDYKLASNAHQLTVIAYPGDVTADSNCSLDSIAGVCRSINSEGYLSFTFFSPTDGAITRLKFGKSESEMKELGSSDFKSIATKNEASNSAGDQYIISTTIYSTSVLENYIPADESNVTLTGLYCLGSDSEFCTMEKSLVSLTLHKASKVIVPDDVLKTTIKNKLNFTDADRIGYTKSIKRVYLSNRIYDGSTYTTDADQNIFRIVIKLGDNMESGNGQGSAVSEIIYDNTVLNAEYYTVYEMTDDASDNKDKYLVVELKADQIETDTNVQVRDESSPVIIKLRNGEKLNDVTMTLMSSAKLKSGSTGASFNPDLIDAKKTVTTTVNGVVQSSEEPNRDYYIEYEVNIDGYQGLIVTNATFADRTILLDTDSANGRVYLSVAAIKQLMDGRDTSMSGYVVLEFNNGFKINKGYSLTLLQ